MVRSKKQSAVLARGGDKAVGGGAFYSKAARPALRVLDSTMNTVGAPDAKAKEKRPTKPRTAAQLYAENECEAMILQSGLHENQSKLAIKTCKDDALAAFKQGEVEQSIVDKFEEKEQAERAKYAKQVDQWNEQHPDEILVINKNGNAVLSQADPEKQKRKEAKAAMKKLKAPGTTAELKGISDRAGTKLKKLQAKKRKQQANGKKEEEGEDEDGDMNESDSDDEAENESDDESEPELSDDEEDEKEEEPVKSKQAKKVAETAKGGKKKTAAPPKQKVEKAEAPNRKRKALEVADEQEEAEDAGGKKKRGNTAATKSKEPAAGADEGHVPKVAKGKAVAKKDDVKKADTKKTAPATATAQKAITKKTAPPEQPAGKKTRASTRAQQDVAEGPAQPQSNKKKPAKAKQADKKAAVKAAGGADEDAQPPRKSRLSRVKTTQNGKKNLGPTMPKPSPEKSNSAYTGNYAVPSDDE